MVPVYVFTGSNEEHNAEADHRVRGGLTICPRLPSDTSTSPDHRPDQEYLCNVRIAAGETKIVTGGFSCAATQLTLRSTIKHHPNCHEPTLKDMIINQIQFADNDKWQRPDWNSVVLSRQGARKLDKGKCIAL